MFQASSSVKVSETKETIAVPELPFFKIHISSQTVLKACHYLSLKFLGSFPTKPEM
jgi:hypothetical protein